MITVHIHANDHEGAHVASAKFALPAVSLSALEAAVKEQLDITVRWAEEKDMLIGHAKAYLTWGGDEARMLSTTGAAVETKGSELPEETRDAEVGVTIIAFGAELEDAEDRLEGLSAAVIGQFGEWCVYAHTCEHHHDHEHEHHHDHDCECHHDHDHEHEHECHHHDHEHHDHDCGDGCGHHHHHHGETPC